MSRFNGHKCLFNVSKCGAAMRESAACGLAKKKLNQVKLVISSGKNIVADLINAQTSTSLIT